MSRPKRDPQQVDRVMLGLAAADAYRRRDTVALATLISTTTSSELTHGLVEVIEMLLQVSADRLSATPDELVEAVRRDLCNKFATE